MPNTTSDAHNEHVLKTLSLHRLIHHNFAKQSLPAFEFLKCCISTSDHCQREAFDESFCPSLLV
jgi:hypothetical protein